MHSKNIKKLITYNSLELSLTHDWQNTRTVDCGCCVFRSKTASEQLQCKLSELFQKHLGLIVQLVLNSFWLRMQKYFPAAKICNLHLQLYNPQFRKSEARPPTHENERNIIHLATPVSGGQYRFQGTGEGFVTADFLKKHCLKEAQQFVCLVQCLSWNSEFPWRHRHFLKQS